MSESGVMPRPEDRPVHLDPYVREVGHMEDMDGVALPVGVNYDAVTIGTPDHGYCLTRTQAEEFAHLFVSAIWEAGANAERMREESDGDGGPA